VERELEEKEPHGAATEDDVKDVWYWLHRKYTDRLDRPCSENVCLESD
jgi:hypothetical protein